MRAVRALIGVSMIVIGTAAIADRNIGEAGWWMLAAFVGLLGFAGLFSAFRS
ncbi:MAG: hypothetical protein AAF567_04210 [Actinomycetota bacterium]